MQTKASLPSSQNTSSGYLAFNPLRISDFISSWPMLARLVQFIPNRFRDVQRTIKLSQQHKLAYGGQIG